MATNPKAKATATATVKPTKQPKVPTLLLSKLKIADVPSTPRRRLANAIEAAKELQIEQIQNVVEMENGLQTGRIDAAEKVVTRFGKKLYVQCGGITFNSPIVFCTCDCDCNPNYHVFLLNVTLRMFWCLRLDPDATS